MNVGTATCLITPRTPQVLGAGGTRRPIASVRDELEANVVTFVDHDTRLAIVSLDLLYPGRAIRAGLEEALGDILAPHEIFVAASHTHTAPAVDSDKPLLGVVDPDYVQLVVESVANCVREAISEQSETPGLSVHAAYANSAINRRSQRFFRLGRSRLRFNETDLGPNPNGPNNETVTAIVVGQQAAPRAVIWNYACHPTSAPLPYQVGAHFPGAVRRRMRSDFSSPRLPVLFLQGFSGDVRPPAIEPLRSPKALLRRVLLGPRFDNFDRDAYATWVAGLWSSVQAAMATPGTQLGNNVKVARVERPLSEFVEGGAVNSTVKFHAISLYPLIVCGVSGEVVTEYSQRLQSCFPGHHALGVGCIDDTFGYVPTTRMLGAGGYEDTSFCKAFGLSQVLPGVEAAMMDGFRGIASALGPSRGEAQ